MRYLVVLLITGMFSLHLWAQQYTIPVYVSGTEGHNILAFCNAYNPRERNSLTLRIRTDEGTLWPISYPIDKNPNQA